MYHLSTGQRQTHCSRYMRTTERRVVGSTSRDTFSQNTDTNKRASMWSYYTGRRAVERLSARVKPPPKTSLNVRSANDAKIRDASGTTGGHKLEAWEKGDYQYRYERSFSTEVRDLKERREAVIQVIAGIVSHAYPKDQRGHTDAPVGPLLCRYLL